MAKTEGDLYEVSQLLPDGSLKTHLVDAWNANAARNHVTNNVISKAKRADGRRVGELIKAGVDIETVTKATA